ncbi:MAG: flagellar hook-associated protein FlgK [Paracoccaceae bacterium]
MGLSSALSIANSGLATVSRAAELVSNNVANATVESYARKELALSPQTVGGQSAGVRVDGVLRAENAQVTAARRQSAAEHGAALTEGEGRARLSALLGLPGAADALASHMVAFEDALRAAGNAPDSTSLLANVAQRAGDIANNLNGISTQTSAVRVAADRSIAQQVETVNSSLKQIESINAQIRMRANSGDVTGLEDERQRLIDQISAIIPIRQLRRDGGDVALYTRNGAQLLDGSAKELGFTSTPTITHDMTLASGALAGLTLNGRPVSVGTGSGQMDGGSLGAAFALRDVIAPAFNAQIDAVARDLAERFESPLLDPTRAPGDPGLFTDAGAPSSPINELGLAGRLQLNALADPSQGGATWRLRDGLGAALPGPAGTSTLLTASLAALAAPRAAPTGAGVTHMLGAADLAGEIAAHNYAANQRADQKTAFLGGQFDALRNRELAETAVDTDREMQHLLVIEQAYAANARVISTVDKLLRTLLEI